MSRRASPNSLDTEARAGVPRVSVITIFYNEERFIEEAIESVLAQDFGDFELLLVDDGSSDASGAIARNYAARHPDRIRYLEHPDHSNRGMSASRNLGLSQARGELIAFIDADDRWRPSKLKEQVELLESLPSVDAVGGSVNYWASHNGGRDRIVPTGHAQNRVVEPGEATINLYPLGKADAPSMSDLLFRRASIDAADGFEEAFTGAYEDQAFLAKFYLKSRLYFTDAVWSDYRLHGDSCMAQVGRAGTYRDARRAFLEWFEHYLADIGQPSDSRILSAVEAALRRYPAKRTRVRDAARRIPMAVTLVRSAKAVANRVRPLVAAGPAILMYHRIAEESFDPWGLAVSPDHFAEQMEWIAQNRRPLPLTEFADLHRRGRLPPDAIAVTFDDGYACNAAAAQVLERLSIPATIFVPPDLIDSGREFWWDELERVVLGHEGESLRLNGHEINLGDKHPDDSDWPAAEPPRTPRQLAYRELWSLLYERKPEELRKGIAELSVQAGVPEGPRDSHRPMTRAELGGIRSDVMEFGSHSLSHASLPLLRTDEKAREIHESRMRCAEVTGAEPRSFAYPYGNFDPESERLVREAGYDCAVKADGWFVRRRTPRFALPRIFVGNWDSARLARQLGRT